MADIQKVLLQKANGEFIATTEIPRFERPADVLTSPKVYFVFDSYNGLTDTLIYRQATVYGVTIQDYQTEATPH
jgi:hypothetical protein